jgi:peptide/nickel transport system substrate-binding protein
MNERREGGAMDFRRTSRLFAIVGVFAIVATACGGGGEEQASPTGGAAAKGGTYRTAIEEFGFTNAFDPTGEYLATAWGLYSELLLRTLVTYSHTAGVAGDEIKPDIAESWETSADGLTWTFHLKSGVMFGPPLDRAVTSKDIAYAFQRINTKSLIAQYGNYYAGVIEGLTGDAKSPNTPISGISTPDDSTIVFTLTKPTGDLLYRLAMGATAPVPPEVGKCFTKAGDYGRFVISSGPYMIKGEDALDTSSCNAMKPFSGYDPDKFMVIVRNPNYDAATDSPEVRSNNLDGVVITIDTNTDDIFNKIQSGDLDGSWASQPPAALEQQYLTNPDLKDNFHADSGDRTWYITMNLLVPPFDDVHVRKAVNYVIDKSGVQRAWGGPAHGEIATMPEPPTVLEATAEDDPYPSPNHEGDVAAAQDEMKQSKYDSNGDGKCDASACNNVLMISRNIPPWTNMNPILQEDLAKIGINVKMRELETSTAYTTIQTADNLVPIAANAGWGKDYADPYGFDFFIFNSAGIACSGQVNYSELGMTKDQAAECGPKVLAAWNAATDNGKTPLPSVDKKMDECYGLAGDARTNCWAELDTYLMEEAVPWVPYLWATAFTVTGDSVTHWEFDQSAGYISFTHISVNNGLDPNTVPVG